MKRKILLLTLGTGDLRNAKESAGYRMTQYTINGCPYQKNGEDKQTNFVAEPIIDFFEPDDIFILGTVKSVWHQFYASVTTSDNNDDSYLNDCNYLRLLDIETNNGINTVNENLVQLGEEISKIFGTIETWDKYSDKYRNQKPLVRVLLTKYGIDSQELKENYVILKGIEKYLSVNNSYEVAFDITHSFRSLPIYNLIIFNYIKNITKYDISISHVYYGNIDASHELENKAPIVDLRDLVEVLDLTNGVTEFKDTGNAVSILPLINSDKDLQDALSRFDLATQLNAFDEIKDALISLAALTTSNSSDARYTGIREMIGTVLGEKFFGGRDCPEIPDSGADLKYMLSIWFYNQNRIGLALATGLEALRDINTPAKEPACSRTSLQEAVCSLGTKLKHYKDIRNMFAHSLGNVEGTDLSDIRNEVENFKDSLIKLKKEYDSYPEAYKNLFVPRTGRGSRRTSNGCRIILEFSGNCDYSAYSKTATGNNYDVYYLNNSVKTEFFSGINGNKYRTVEKAYFLTEYLKSRLPEEFDEIHILLFECPDMEKEMIIRAILEQLENSDRRVQLYRVSRGTLTACRKTRLHISIGDHQNELKDKEPLYAKVMNASLEKV